MKVKIYTTATCPFCVMAKEFFKKNKVEYEEVHVDTDESGKKEMLEKSGQMGVPVVEIDGKIVIGFDEPALKKLLNVK